MKKPKQPKTKHKQQQYKSPSPLSRQQPSQGDDHRSRWKRIQDHPIWSAIGIFASAIAVTGTIYDALRGPEIRPDAAVSSSWADLPITVRDASILFDLRDAQFFCDVTDVTWRGAGTTAYRIVGRGEYVVPRPPITIEPGAASTFPCDISKHMTAKYNFGSQLPIALIQMRIRVSYKTRAWPWVRSALSQQFTWRAVSGGYQWLEGDTSDAIN
jgi:hypothetical protein